MGWWSMGGFPKEIMGDGPADVASDAFARLRDLRTRADRPPLRYEDISALLLAAVSRAGRDIAPRPHCKLHGLAAAFRDGSPEIRLTIGDVPVAPDELTRMRDLLHHVARQYRDAVERRPSMQEALASAAFVLRPVPNDYLAPDETRELDDFHAIFRDDRGQLSAPEVVAMVAATMRRNERRLGLVALGGEAMLPKEVVATTKDGREIRAGCATTKAPSPDLVDDVCARLDAITADHGSLLPLDRLVDALLETFGHTPERFEELASLRVVTTPCSPAGRPSASARAAQVEPPPGNKPRVHHSKFGAGTVLQVIESGGEKKYEIAFDNGTTRTLLARFVEELG